MFPLQNDQICFVSTTNPLSSRQERFKHLLCKRVNDVRSHQQIGEPQKKPLTFQYTGCLIGILAMV